MPSLLHQVPKYCRHRASGQAYVNIEGQQQNNLPATYLVPHSLYLVSSFVPPSLVVIRIRADPHGALVDLLGGFAEFFLGGFA
jgi:hypothetical protein